MDECKSVSANELNKEQSVNEKASESVNLLPGLLTSPVTPHTASYLRTGDMSALGLARPSSGHEA